MSEAGYTQILCHFKLKEVDINNLNECAYRDVEVKEIEPSNLPLGSFNFLHNPEDGDELDFTCQCTIPDGYDSKVADCYVLDIPPFSQKDFMNGKEQAKKRG